MIKKLVQMLSIFSFIPFNFSVPKINFSNTNSISFEKNSDNEDILYPSIELQENSKIKNNILRFILNKNIKINDISANGMNIDDVNINNNILSININIQDKFSSISLSLNKEDKQPSFSKQSETSSNDLIKTFYVYKKGDEAFISSISTDDAIKNADENPLKVNSPFSIESSAIIKPEYELTPHKSPMVHGKILWQDRKGNKYPLDGAKITLNYHSNDFKDYGTITKYTNENGYFDTTVPKSSSYTYNLTLYPYGEHVKVMGIKDTKDAVNKYKDIESEYSLSLTDHIDSLYNDNAYIIKCEKNKIRSDIGEAFQVFQGLYYFSKYEQSIKNNTVLPSVTAYYPCNKKYTNAQMSDVDVAFYNDNEEVIIVPNTMNSNQKVSSFESWDLLGHEFGHHVSKYYNCTINNSPSYKHRSYMDDITFLKTNNHLSDEKCISYGLPLAWQEAWPTYWMEIAEHSFPDELKANYASKTIANEKYEAANMSTDYPLAHNENFKFEISNKDYNGIGQGGEAHERGIIRFLYELNRKMGQYNDDEVPMIDNLWKPIINCGIYIKEKIKNLGSNESETFSDFYNYLLSMTQDTGKYKNITALDLMQLSKNYWISQKELTIKNGIVKWTNGGNAKTVDTKSKTYLYVFNENGLIIKTISLNEIARKKEYVNNIYEERMETINSNVELEINNIQNSGTCSIWFMESPYFDSSKTHPNDKFTGPYGSIIYQGKPIDFKLSNLTC